MRKVAGWLLVAVGGFYPALLVLMWLVGLGTLLASGRIVGLEHLVKAVWPIGIAVSVTILSTGVWLTKAGAGRTKEANNAGKQR